MQSLRDKLLKAGLVTEAEAKQAEQQPSRPPRRERDVGGGPQRRPEPAAARIPKLPPLPGSREAQRLESKRQLELDRQIRELVTVSEVPVDPGPHTFYFVTRKNRLRRLELTDAQAALLEQGVLAVVERPDPGQIEHALVKAEVIPSLLQLSERAVRFFNRPEQPIGCMNDQELQARKAEEGPGETEPTPSPTPE